MNPHKLLVRIGVFVVFLTYFFAIAVAQKQKPPAGGPLGVVVDERLSAVRETPSLDGKLIRRVGRGRLVAMRRMKRSDDGVVFSLVNLNSRTHGWIQREAVVSPLQRGDDQRLLLLIRDSADLDRIIRARIFLTYFPRSPLRAEVLLLIAEAAESNALKLSQEALRRLRIGEGGAPEFSYFLNYVGLDRYNRQGVMFIFDRQARRFRYDGAAWKEIVRRYPDSPQAVTARERIRGLDTK